MIGILKGPNKFARLAKQETKTLTEVLAKYHKEINKVEKLVKPYAEKRDPDLPDNKLESDA